MKNGLEITCPQSNSLEVLSQPDDLPPDLLLFCYRKVSVLPVQRMKHISPPQGFDLSEEKHCWVPVWMIGEDIVTRLPLALGIHKKDLSLAEQSLHRVIFYFQGDGALPRHVRRLKRAVARMVPDGCLLPTSWPIWGQLSSGILLRRPAVGWRVRPDRFSIVIACADSPFRRNSTSMQTYFANFSHVAGSAGSLSARICSSVRGETPMAEVNSFSVAPSANSFWVRPFRFTMETPNVSSRTDRVYVGLGWRLMIRPPCEAVLVTHTTTPQEGNWIKKRVARIERQSKRSDGRCYASVPRHLTAVIMELAQQDELCQNLKSFQLPQW